MQRQRTDEYLLNVAKHELTHALGFSSFLFSYFRDENGVPRSPRTYYGYPMGTSTNTVKNVVYNNWKTANGLVPHSVNMLVTPNLKEEARKHFGCSTMEGLELENQGSTGSVGSHWEARVTQGEVMNARIDQGSVVAYSHMTLALLEDSGWYKANYSKAGERLLWGAGAGCELAAGSCKGYMDSQKAKGKSVSPYTDLDPQALGLGYRCDIHRESLGFSNFATFGSSLPPEYRYFSNSRKGGSYTYGDYCPFIQAYNGAGCKDVSNQQPSSTNIYAETYGPKSRCVEHGVRWQMRVGNSIRYRYGIQAGCYEYKCSNGQVTIYILGQAYSCSSAGQELSVSQTTPDGVKYTGSIICPSCLEICYDDVDNCPEAANLFSTTVTAQSVPVMPSNVPVQHNTTEEGTAKSHFKKFSMPSES